MESDVDRERGLIQEALAGAVLAFSDLVRLRQAAVQAYLGRAIRNLDVVEDLAQETFLKAYRNLARFRGESSFRVWLFGIARGEMLMHWRQERTRLAKVGRPLGGALAEWLGGRMDGESAGPELHDRKLAALEGCVQGLPGHSATLVQDFYVRGHSIGRIAQACGKSEVAVRVTLLRIRRALRDCVAGKIESSGANP